MKRLSILFFVFSISIGFLNCKPYANTQDIQTQNMEMFGTKWLLKTLNNSAISLDSEELEQPYLILNKEEKTASGHGSCNAFGGTMLLSEDHKVSFEKFRVTMRYCENNALEKDFLAALHNTDSLALENGKLSLLDKNGKVLASFTPDQSAE